MYIIGVDIGGTFTDVALLDGETGVPVRAKAPTTPSDLKQGVLDALEVAARRANLDLASILGASTRFVHGTTSTINALVTGNLATVGLLTTAGFEDHLIIMRGVGRHAGLAPAQRLHFSILDRPAPIVPRSLTAGIAERVDYEGRILTPLDEDEARRAVRTLVEMGAKTLAVSLLWSFKNPKHEQRIKALAEELYPNVLVTLSSDYFPVIGEYERTSTTVINASIAPIIDSYVEELGKELGRRGLRCPLSIMTSAGGVTSVQNAKRLPVSTIGSGPAGGVIASKFIADALGFRNVIVTDVGGTTFDVGLIVDGEPRMALTSTVAKHALLNPLIDVTSIGSGGGSIAWVDMGRLRVGPHSAGSDPGPACYGRGGRLPAVTDADLVLGYINPDYFCGGEVRLERGLAEEAIREHVADPLFGGDVVKAAAGIRRVIDAQMGDLMRKVTIECGYDPKDFVVMAYGGAGPTHCLSYGRELGISTIIVPFLAESHSAFGAAVADLFRTYKLSDPQPTPVPAEKIAALFARTDEEVLQQFEADGVPRDRVTLRRWVEMRYRRQVHDIPVPFPSATPTDADVAQLIEAFEDAYRLLYGKESAYRVAGIDVMAFRTDGICHTAKPELARSMEGPSDPDHASKGSRPIYLMDRQAFAEVPIYDGTRLLPGNRVVGPAVIEHYGTTILLEPGSTAAVDAFGNTFLRVEGALP